ncbi:MAG: hypothetical protein DHS20C18_41680 [Saprospiraceae bacterium]|nr:MAG: hypothetical protein DHS20C18_41680 [Saprospiraceae bacterium]
MACAPTPPDLGVETKKIMALHDLQQKYHLEKMASEFAALMSEHFISVNRGKVTTPTYVENKERFQKYFDAVEFVKWEDTEAPIIRFSDDATVAYTVVQKEVVTRYAYEGVPPTEESTHFSWVAIYRKIKGEWAIDCVASTNLEPETTPLATEPD